MCCKPYQKSAQHYSCLARVKITNTKIKDTTCQITQQSEKYIITNFCLLVLVDIMKTKKNR